MIRNKNVKLALIGFPLDETSTYMKGPALAPPLIREAFRCDSSNTWSELGVDLGEKSVFYSVLRGDCLAFGGFWAGGGLGVCTIGVGLFLC